MDLQSVIMRPEGSAFKDFSGWDHKKLGSLIKLHMQRIQVSLSKELDIAHASALKVDLTTLPICFKFHTMEKP